jgi:hypothetical protein
LHWLSKNLNGAEKSKTYFIVASKSANKRKTQKLKENVSQEPEPNVECVESDVKTKSMETASQEKCKKLKLLPNHYRVYRVYPKKRPKWEISSNSDIPQSLEYFV